MTDTESIYSPRGPVHICDAINKTMVFIEKWQSGVIGIPSGLPSLDQVIKGWQAGELVIVGGRPAVGKTAFALTLARNAAINFNIPTAFFSLEMSTVSLTRRLIVSETRLPSCKLHGSVSMDNEDWSSMEKSLRRLSGAPLYIDDTPALSTQEFTDRVKDLHLNHGVKLVFVDYLHLMTDQSCPRLSAEEKNERILRALKETALLTGTAVIAISHVRRPTRKNYVRPTLPDLFLYCPAAADYADRILLLHRPSFLSLDCREGNYSRLEFEVAKNNIGDVALFDLYLDKDGIKVVEENDISEI